jgi:hypothetical protein
MNRKKLKEIKDKITKEIAELEKVRPSLEDQRKRLK